MVYVISHGNKWAVKKPMPRRVLRLFDYREQAFHYAMGLGISKIVVHKKDGSVLFIEKLP